MIPSSSCYCDIWYYAPPLGPVVFTYQISLIIWLSDNVWGVLCSLAASNNIDLLQGQASVGGCRVAIIETYPGTPWHCIILDIGSILLIELPEPELSIDIILLIIIFHSCWLSHHLQCWIWFYTLSLTISPMSVIDTRLPYMSNVQITRLHVHQF